MTAAQAAETDGDDAKEEVVLPDPDFDEAEYKSDEVQKGKLAVLNTGYGVFLGSVAAVVQNTFASTWKVGWAVLAVGLLGLNGIYRLGGIEDHEWGAKEFLGAAVTLFFSFLAFWYLFLNPPFV